MGDEIELAGDIPFPEEVVTEFDELADDIGPSVLTKTGDFFQDVTISLGTHHYGYPRPHYRRFFESVGIVYARSDDENRRAALSQLISYLDDFAEFVVHEIVQDIDEPWLAMDLIVNRPTYDPQIEFFAHYIRKRKGRVEIMDQSTNSRFWLAEAVVRAGNLPTRRALELHRDFYQRTLDAIAGLCYSKCLQGGTYRQLEKYPLDLREDITDRMEHARFIELDQAL